MIRNRSQWIAPTDCETQGEGSSNVRWTLNHSTEVESQAEDNERIISELRREVEDLKREARNRSPAKERPRNRVNLSRQKNFEYMPSAEVRAEFSLAQDDSASSISRLGSHRSLESHKRSRPYQPLHVDCSPLKKKPTRRKTVQSGEQHVVWKALDLVSSSPFSSAIKRPILPERFTALRFETYNGRTDPVAHISHYQQRMALC